MLLIMSSLTLQPNLFHEFQPIGGVGARFADGEAFCCANRAEAKIKREMRQAAMIGLVFMRNVVPECYAPMLENLADPQLGMSCISSHPENRHDLQFGVYSWPTKGDRLCL